MTTNSQPEAKQLAELAQRFLNRARRGDLSTDHAQDDEREALRERIESPLGQDYAAWRRAALWVAGALLALTALLNLANWIDALTQDDSTFGGLPRRVRSDLSALVAVLESALFLSAAVAAVFVIGAARQWTDLGSSRRSARIAWALLFLTPIVMAVIPWSALVSNEGLGEAESTMLQASVGLIIAIALFMKIGPVVIGLCAGVVRSSMTVKTLLPESPLPGWAAVAFAPLYALLLIVVMVIVHQTSGNVVLFLGIGALVASPLTYLLRARDLLRPHRAEEISTVLVGIRTRAAILNLAGIALLGIFVLTKADLGVLQGLGFVSAALGGALLMTVVAADLMIDLIGAEWRQSHTAESASLRAQLDAKLAELQPAPPEPTPAR
ncbi:MAG: hypothetical protein IPM29_21135 [Planctomycetes bacterium]|nr:hypothetical protein [Planctomycetota bacterium]